MKISKLGLSRLAPVLAPVLSLAAMSLVGCAQPTNPDLMAPAVEVQIASDSKPIESTVVFQPKVDILFVIDNSDSMKSHQETLKKNIDRFVEAFEKNKRIDFQIGVTAIYDSVRYGSVVKDFHPLGQLYPVKRAGAAAAGTESLNFITRAEPGYAQVLGETLKIGTLPYKDKAGVDVGPENEELFSPVLAALDGRNIGFPRADAHLAVIMITDADDVSSIEPSKLRSELTRIKSNDQSMVSTFAVLALTCSKVDPGIKGTGPVKIQRFLKESGGKAYNLCDNHYGDRLAEAGRLIEKKATKNLRIPLEAPPVNDAQGNITLRVVFYEASTAVDEAERSRICATGENQLGKSVWYDARRRQVVVPGSAMEGKPESTTIAICYEKANMAKAGTSWLETESSKIK